MSMVIANNMSAVNTKRQFATSASGMASAMERLSSGYKINTGKDDPSGLVISEKLRSQLNGLKRAQQNTEEAINVMGIAEGALNEMNSILKKMKALAIHSSNTGVTSADQIAADQSEMDSAIQTLDRIAQTTKFSGDNLLNGAKDIAYEQDTLIKGTQQNSLLNTRESNFSQIFKRDGYSVSFNFTGTKKADAVTGIGDVDFSQQAMKAYLEVDTTKGSMSQIDENGNFTQDQAFTLTGIKGSRAFKFKQGTSVTDMVSQIKSVADSTGIDASLVFNSSQKIDKLGDVEGLLKPGVMNKMTLSGMGAYNAAGAEVTVAFEATKAVSDELLTAMDKAGYSSMNLVLKAQDVGSGTEAYDLNIVMDNGDEYTLAAAWDGATALSAAGIAAVGGANTDVEAVLQKLTLTMTGGPIVAANTLPTGAAVGDTLGTSNAVVAKVNPKTIVGGAGAARENGTLAVFNNVTASGTGKVLQGVKDVKMADGAVDSVQYGMNTDGQGRIYVKFLDDTGTSFELYKDSAMTAESLVATGINGQEIKEANNSGLKGITLDLAGETVDGKGLSTKKGVYIAFAGIEGNSKNTDGTSGVVYNGSVVGTPTSNITQEIEITGLTTAAGSNLKVTLQGSPKTQLTGDSAISIQTDLDSKGGLQFKVKVGNGETVTWDGKKDLALSGDLDGVKLKAIATEFDVTDLVGTVAGKTEKLEIASNKTGNITFQLDLTNLDKEAAAALAAAGVTKIELAAGDGTLADGSFTVKAYNGTTEMFSGTIGVSEQLGALQAGTMPDWLKDAVLTIDGTNYSKADGDDAIALAGKGSVDSTTALKGGVPVAIPITHVGGTETVSASSFNVPDDFTDTALFDANKTLITGVELGKNTSDEGTIYMKNVYDAKAGTVQVFAYKHKDMRDEDMVAKSDVLNVKTNGQAAEALTVVLNEIRNADNTAGTGLGMVLSVDAAAFTGKDSATLKGDLTFTNLGARVHAQDYGSNSFVKVTQDKGAIFTYYGSAGDNSSATLIDAGEKGTSIQVNGQDATLSVNGMQVKSNGLNLNMATQDIQASLVFNGGKVGSTTLAQVGYGDGSIFTKIGALNLGSTEANEDGLSGLLCNAGHTTNEKITDFQNGMQLQLGEGAGDQNRTVVAIKSMTSENLGRVSKGGYWETGSAVYSNMTFTMKDVMGGGMASLSQDPTLAMSIIDQAISDVSELRAQIGAVQTNMLQTNSNNLSVTMENIQKTESGIRDADMADEMTDFTKQQVLQNAAMSMMSQANQSSQNVLQLLR